MELKTMVHQIEDLKKIIREKNEIIEHLKVRVDNQEQQINFLTMDAEEKHFQMIRKCSIESISPYLIKQKYLLLRVDDLEPSGIYLPKTIKLASVDEISPLPRHLPALK